MKLSRLLWAIPLVGVLSGCSQSEMAEQGQNPNTSIRFAITAGKQTKASVVDNTTVKDTPFGLFAYSSKDQWAAFKAGSDWATARPNVMYNQLVSYNKDSKAWTYEPLKFWSDNESYAFFGYWPMDSKFIATDGGAYANAGTLPTIKFKQNVTDPTQMADFVVAHELDKTKEDGTVTLNFKHVLTRLNFKARLDDDLGTKTSASTRILVRGLRILGTANCGEDKYASGENADSKFYGSGTYVLADDDTNGKWTLEDDAKVTDPLSVDQLLTKETFDITKKEDNGDMTTFTYPNSGASVALDGTVTPLLTTNQYLFLIPPQGSSTSGITDGDKDIRIQLDYDVVSIDPQLPEGYKASSNTVTASLPKEQLVEGKAYSIIFTLGVQAIKVSGNVEDWKNEEETTAPSQNAETADADGIKAAWAALNDIKATNKNGKYFVINVPTTPTADLDLSLDGTFTADKISNFETNDQVELKMLDGKSFDNTITKLPEGWFFVRRTVGTEVRYILIKTTTKVGSTVDAWNSSAWSSNMGGTNESGKNN